MRDLKRIKRILRLIRKIWLKNPTLRLTQLIGNCFAHEDLYYKEDNDLERKLKEEINDVIHQSREDRRKK